MSTDDSPLGVASAYFDAWKANDIERVRPLLHTDVDFVGALGKTHGVAETLSGLGGMFAMTRQVEVIHRWVDGPDVLTWFELRTATAGPMGDRQLESCEGRPHHPHPGHVRPTPDAWLTTSLLQEDAWRRLY